jgi:hypothetical protein
MKSYLAIAAIGAVLYLTLINALGLLISARDIASLF